MHRHGQGSSDTQIRLARSLRSFRSFRSFPPTHTMVPVRAIIRRLRRRAACLRDCMDEQAAKKAAQEEESARRAGREDPTGSTEDTPVDKKEHGVVYKVLDAVAKDDRRRGGGGRRF